MKPHLACDWDEKKVAKKLRERGYLIIEPKIDGVRGCNLAGRMTGRSLKEHGNTFTTDFYSDAFYVGMDGELAAQAETHPDLCRLTTSAVNTHEGEPYLMWHVFDYLHPSVINEPYHHRLYVLNELLSNTDTLARRVRAIPSFLAHTMEDIEGYDEHFLDMGYEGSIIRDPMGLHKNGRSTATEANYLRIKRFIEEDALVLSVEEGQQNNNVATVNELGQTERSTHQANMVPNGMVGSMQCKVLKDVFHRGNMLFQKDQIITVAAGSMTHSDRKALFENPQDIVGHIVKFKTFPVGVKDKPRFPTYKSHRAPSDFI